MKLIRAHVDLDMYKALGVQAEAIAVTEVTSALNNNIVTGFDNTPLFSLAAGWIDSIDHFTLSRHIYQPAGVIYSKSFIDKLPKDLQELVLKDPLAEAANGRAGVRALEAALISTIKEMNKQVWELEAEQRKAFRKMARKKTHAAFLAKNPSVQATYKDVKLKLKELRGK